MLCVYCEDDGEGFVEVVGFMKDGEVIGGNGEFVGFFDVVMKEEGVEVGGWVFLIGVYFNVFDGWEEVVSVLGSWKCWKS